jgi:hypothetical protein
MSLDTAALRYWTASKALLNPATAEDDALNAAVQLALMTDQGSRVVARHASKTIDTADARGLLDIEYDLVQEA